MLCSPESSDPQDAVVAKQYIEQKSAFDKQAREWTAKYANPDSVEKAKIKQLTDMGFDEETARKALEKFKWDENLAVNSLLC